MHSNIGKQVEDSQYDYVLFATQMPIEFCGGVKKMTTAFLATGQWTSMDALFKIKKCK